MKKNHFKIVLPFFLILSLLLGAGTAFCAVGAGGSLPYEGWLASMVASATGPIAFTFAMIGIVGAGGVLIFGGELNGFLRSILFIILVMGLLVGANNMMSTFFGRGAVVASAVEVESVPSTTSV